MRHKNWMNFRKELINFARKQHGGKLRNRFTHPDLQDIPSRQGDFIFELIKKNLSISHGSFLNFGARLGYFCSKFDDDEGFDCYAVEDNPMHLYFLKKLKIAEHKRFKIISESICNYKKKEKIVYDVLLDIDKFQDCLKKENSYLKLINLLGRLEIKELFIGFYYPRRTQKKKSYRSYNVEQFITFINENSSLTKAKIIGRIKGGLNIIKFTS